MCVKDTLKDWFTFLKIHLEKNIKHVKIVDNNSSLKLNKSKVGGGAGMMFQCQFLVISSLLN